MSERIVVLGPAGFVRESFYGPIFETPMKLSLNAQGIASLETTFSAIAAIRDEDRELAWQLFWWVRRSWDELDAVSKFMALFTAMERVLEGIPQSKDSKPKEMFSRIESILKSSSDSESGTLLEFLSALKQRYAPSLRERFALVAKERKPADWTRDTETFTLMNEERKKLFHGAHQNPALAVRLASGEMVSLEKFVEEYVAFKVFGDSTVYTHYEDWRSKDDTAS